MYTQGMRYKLAPVRAQGRVRTAWELAVFAAAVLSLIVGPLAVAFGALLRAWYLVPALVVDVLFLADIAFRFNCAYVEQREEVRDRGRIAWRYIRRFFPLTFSLPWRPSRRISSCWAASFPAALCLYSSFSQG